MKHPSIIISFFLLFTIPAIIVAIFHSDPSEDTESYTLVWNEEFDSDTLNTDIWIPWEGGAYNNEQQCYTSREENLFIQDGKLHIRALDEQYECGSSGIKPYTSARISTDSTAIGWEHGRFEAKIKMPAGIGFWPAFWMMPMREIGWPKGGEIDIMEYRGDQPTVTHAAAHYWRENCTGETRQCLNSEVSTFDAENNLSEEFHIYALERTNDEMRWYFNDERIQTVSINDLPSDYDPFTGQFHIILNLAVGGDFLPNPDQSTPFPATMKVDYVRVYQ